MQFWLSYNNFQEKFQLPVNPSEFSISTPHKNNVIDIHGLGEINLIGSPGLATIELSSIFPKNYAPYCAYKDIPKPYDAVALIQKWKATKRPIRLIITGTKINMAVSIEDFRYGERGGSFDVEYTLTLKEYRFIDVKQVNDNAAEENIRVSAKEIPKTYTVKSGDSLYFIAKKQTGNGDNWRKIYDANKSLIGKDPGKLVVGQKLVISV